MHAVFRAPAVVLACALLAARPALAAPDEPVRLLRGSIVPDPPGPVMVLRGTVPPALPPAEPPPAAGPATAVGGDRLWLLDRDTDRLVACRLVGTSTVGRRAIECVARRSIFPPG